MEIPMTVPDICTYLGPYKASNTVTDLFAYEKKIETANLTFGG